MDEFFRNTLGRLQMAPPDAVWQRVEYQLVERRRKAKKLLFLRYAASVAAVIGLSCIGWLVFRQTNQGDFIVQHPSVNTPSSQYLISSNTADNSFSTSTHREENKVLRPEEKVSKEIYKSQVLDTFRIEPEDDKLAFAGGNAASAFPADAVQVVADATPQAVVVNSPSPGYYQAQRYLDSLKYAAMPSPENEPAKITEKWALSGHAAPTYTYRTLGSGADKQLNHQEAGIIAYSAGLGMEYKAGNRWRIRSGVYLSRYGNSGTAQATVTNTATAYASPKPMRSISVESSVGELNNGVASADGAIADENISVLAPVDQVEGTYTQMLDYIEVPLAIRYRLAGKKLGVNVLGGIGANVLVANHSKVDLSTSSLTDYSDNDLATNSVKKYNFNSSIGLGIQYRIGQRITLDLEPVFKVFINSVNQSSDKLVYPYSVGVYTGFTYLL